MNREPVRWGFVAAVGGALWLALSLFSSNGASAAGPRISIDSFESSVGVTAKVDVRLEDMGPPGAGAWTVDIHFDPEALTALDCTPEQGGGVCNEAYDPGVARVVGTNIYGLEGDAVLASISFSCKKPGESALEVAISVLVDATPGDPTNVDAKTENASASCSDEPIKPTPTPSDDEAKVAGDANCDGRANALDAALVLQYVAGLIDQVSCVDADYNHDNETDAIDATLILQKDAGLID